MYVSWESIPVIYYSLRKLCFLVLRLLYCLYNLNPLFFVELLIAKGFQRDITYTLNYFIYHCPFYVFYTANLVYEEPSSFHSMLCFFFSCCTSHVYLLYHTCIFQLVRVLIHI